MNRKEQQFVEVVLDFYREHGRTHLPWRKTARPYNILVSELMLQQTQVDRVIPKYQEFIKHWPTMTKLANARLSEVLRVWQGLGYNRRAKFLHRCAQQVVTEHNGRLPKDLKTLQTLPGIGQYTASAIMAFAHNHPVRMVETNIRTAYLHHFFPVTTDVSDKEIFPIIEATMLRQEPRVWYSALMDYGSHLKRTVGNLNQKAQGYKKQSVFKGSDREIRGAIIRTLTASSTSLTKTQLNKKLTHFDAGRVAKQLQKLSQEGLVVETGKRIQLP
jgi:A/G-specific adenine glycosylase